ncbi:MAG: hypothetical protein Q7K54_02845, partial [Candidatus Parcubacteria bacterium]|nr:hypothetical protein [Candidatus Parcubacteria bacterium]
NDTPVVSQHRGGSILLLAQNNLVIESEIVPPPIIVTEIPTEVPILKQEDNPKVLALKKNIVTTQIATTPIKVKNLPKENTLTANVVESKTPINNKIVVSVFIGSVVLLLVAKFIIKV